MCKDRVNTFAKALICLYYSHQRCLMKSTNNVGLYPNIDVIIPTLNCEFQLEQCLKSIRKQIYDGIIEITIIDGGSTDNTIKVASKYGAVVIVKEGMYGTGKNGARHFGELITKNPIVWNIDSDNILVEDLVASQLVDQLIYDNSINIVIPETAIDINSSKLNKWISKDEIINVNRMKNKAYRKGEVYVLEDMDYGLTNCAMIRRSILQMVGGYDSDVRLLLRMRKLQIAKVAIVSSAHFYHNQVNSFSDLVRKWDRRIKLFGEFDLKDFSEYFVDYPINSYDHRRLQLTPLKTILKNVVAIFSSPFKNRDSVNIWPFLNILLILILFVKHPNKFLKLYTQFL